MRQWRVSDVMTAPVITTAEHTPVAELVGIMSTHRVSAVPIVGDDDRVVGLVSEADLLAKVAATGPAAGREPRKGRAAKAAATSAADLMSAPVLSITPRMRGARSNRHAISTADVNAASPSKYSRPQNHPPRLKKVSPATVAQSG